MIKRQPIPIISEEKEYENQFYHWLHDSHYWIEGENGSLTCKWCGILSLPTLNSSRLCVKNPEILRILSTLDNPINSIK